MFRPRGYFVFSAVSLTLAGVSYALPKLFKSYDLIGFAIVGLLLFSVAGGISLWLGVSAQQRRHVARSNDVAAPPHLPTEPQDDPMPRGDSALQGRPQLPPLFVWLREFSEPDRFGEEEVLAKFRARRMHVRLRLGENILSYSFGLWRIMRLGGEPVIFGEGEYNDRYTGRRRRELGWVTIRFDALTELWDLERDQTFEGPDIETFLFDLVAQNSGQDEPSAPQ